MAFLDELVAFLATGSIGTAGTNLFSGFMPDTPDACTVVYETGGAAPEFALGGAAVLHENPSAQFVFRGASRDYDGPRATAEAAITLVSTIRTQTSLSGTLFYLAQPLQSPFVIRVDEKERFLIGFNASFIKEASA